MDRDREKIEKAIQAFRAQDVAGAERLLKKVVAKNPTHFDALYLLGIVLRRAERPDDAIRYLQRAARLHPDDADVQNTLGGAFFVAARGDEAIDCLSRAIALAPPAPEARFNRANIYAALGRMEAAAADYRALVDLKIETPAPYLRLAEILLSGGALQEAREVLDAAIAACPESADAYCFRGNVVSELGRPEEALDDYDRAIFLLPAVADFHLNKAQLLAALGRTEAALQSYDRAAAVAPETPDALVGKGETLTRLGRLEEAFVSFNQAFARDPQCADALGGRAGNLYEAGFLADALRDYEDLARLRGDETCLVDLRGFIRRQMAGWSFLDAERAGVCDLARRGAGVASAFAVLSISDSEALNTQAARAAHDALGAPTAIAPSSPGDRIRLGYFSADFHDHATAQLLARVLELADRERFELIGFSFGPDRQDAYRARLTSAFEKFVDVRDVSDDAVARLARENNLDIAVDLKGLTKGARPGIFARRAAPIQVNYLGYPASMGADFMDYVIADRTVVPEESRGSFSEKVIWLPDSYQPNDPEKKIAETRPRRTDVGLPEDAFVFCCFNNAYKILPEVFDVWMRILSRVPGSVLWLLDDNRWASENLRQAAAARGVAPTRLVFAPRIGLAEHLARHALADLALDTLPYCAHTTASDALFVGVPLATCVGSTFAGRVSASLLTAAGLTELIAPDLAAYENLAVELAGAPQRLSDLRGHWNANRTKSALFDAGRYARNLEAAYRDIHARYRRGLGPEHIAI